MKHHLHKSYAYDQSILYGHIYVAYPLGTAQHSTSTTKTNGFRTTITSSFTLGLHLCHCQIQYQKHQINQFLFKDKSIQDPLT